MRSLSIIVRANRLLTVEERFHGRPIQIDDDQPRNRQGHDEIEYPGRIGEAPYQWVDEGREYGDDGEDDPGDPGP